jgi:homospermidine synthase
MRDLIRRAFVTIGAAGVLAAGMVAAGAGATGAAAAATTVTATEAALPANTASNPAVNLTSVSCASAGNCTAVGSYIHSSGKRQGLLLTQTAGTWATGTQAALPTGVKSNPGVTLPSVSCASAGNCTAVGSWIDSSGNRHGLLLTQTAGTWAAGTDAPLPANAASNPLVLLRSVSCASAGNCTAVGLYTDSSGNSQGLLLTQTSPT